MDFTQGGNLCNRFGNRLQSRVGGGMEGTVSRCVIRITLLNISSDWMGVLEAALRALQQGNVGLGFLQETKLTKGIHMRYIAGYTVWAA